MPALLDQRHLCGPETLPDPDTAMHWSRIVLAKLGRPEYRAGSAQARVDNDRWIVDCDCGGGHDTGVACTPGYPEALCCACGALITVVWPPQAELDEATEVLELRPPGHANWNPATETVADLKLENLEHAVPFVAERGRSRPQPVHPAVPDIMQRPSGLILRSTDPATGAHRYDRRDR